MLTRTNPISHRLPAVALRAEAFPAAALRAVAFPAAALRAVAFPALFLALGLGLHAVPTPAAAQDEEIDLLALTDEVALEVAGLRGWEFKHPVEKAIYSEEELKGFIKKRIDEEYTEKELADTQTFLKMVGAIPKDIDLVQTLTQVLLSQVGGFYDPEVKSFFLIDRKDVDYGPFVTRVFVAHELTHALDDQYVDLHGLMQSREKTEDGEFLVGSLIEGSATALMTAYVTRAQRSGKLNPQDLMEVMESEVERSQAFFEAPPYFHTLIGTYTCGMHFLLKGDLMSLVSGTEDVSGDNLLKALEDPPLSSEQIIHSEKYWKDRDDPVVVSDEAVSAAVEKLGYSVTATNTAGEALMAVITHSPDRPFDPMASGMPGYWTNDAATGWGGDRFYLLEGENGTRGLWVTLWDTAEDRDEFVAAYDRMAADSERHRILLGERGALFLFAMTDAERKAMAGLDEASLGLTRSGETWSAAPSR